MGKSASAFKLATLTAALLLLEETLETDELEIDELDTEELELTLETLLDDTELELAPTMP